MKRNTHINIMAVIHTSCQNSVVAKKYNLRVALKKKKRPKVAKLKKKLQNLAVVFIFNR